MTRGRPDTAERGPGSVGLTAEALWAPDFPPMQDFPLEQSLGTIPYTLPLTQVKSVDGHLVRPDAAPRRIRSFLL